MTGWGCGAFLPGISVCEVISQSPSCIGDNGVANEVVAVAMLHKVMIFFILSAHMAISANNINRFRNGKVLAMVLFRGE